MDFNQLVNNLEGNACDAKWVEEMPLKNLLLVLSACDRNPGRATLELYKKMMYQLLKECPAKTVLESTGKYLAKHEEARKQWVATGAIQSDDIVADIPPNGSEVVELLRKVVLSDEQIYPLLKTSLISESTAPASLSTLVTKGRASSTMDALHSSDSIGEGEGMDTQLKVKLESPGPSTSPQSGPMMISDPGTIRKDSSGNDQADTCKHFVATQGTSQPQRIYTSRVVQGYPRPPPHIRKPYQCVHCERRYFTEHKYLLHLTTCVKNPGRHYLKELKHD